MNQNDIDFFEAYKHLDKLCGEIFNCNNGVSAYILEMEKSPKGQYYVDSWLSDYKALKHIKWVRNQIAHDTTNCIWSNNEDLSFVESFYNRIINQDDPFAQLRKLDTPPKQKVTNKSTSSPITHQPVYQNKNNKKKNSFAGYLLISAIILILILIYCTWR